MKCRKKPVTVDFIRWTGRNLEECIDFLGGNYLGHSAEKRINGWSRITLITFEGPLTASEGDYIIRGVLGEHYPIKPDIFDMTYEVIDNDSK
jgi:hypothetical protein